MPGIIPALPYPLVNGHAYSFASINVWFGNLPYPNIAFKSINYDVALDPGEMRGTDPHVIGFTRGNHTVKADAEIFRLAWEPLKATLGFGGVGYGEVFFNIVVQYREQLSMPIITDVLENFRITASAYSNQQGTEPSGVKLTLKGMDISENGAFIAVPLGA
jgi:hypothetical protein